MNKIENAPVKRSASCRLRQASVGVAVAAGTVAAGAGTTFATPTPTEEAGTALGTLATDGASFIGTYAIPAAVTALGIGLVLALFVKLGKRVRGMF